MAAIICLGIVVRDLVFSVPALRSGAQKLTASSLFKGGGGMAATAAVAAAALGGRVQLWTRLGDDADGRELRDELQSLRVQVRTNLVPGTQTPSAAVLVADDGERLLAVFPGRLDVLADWLPLGDVASVQAVHADFRWPQGARALYAAALARHIPRVLDADLGDPVAVRALLPLVDHAIFSQAGLAELTAHADVDAALHEAAQLTPGIVGVTLGEHGSAFLIGGVLHRVRAFAVAARNTNGAGDVFHGAYTLALAQGLGVLEAARFASAAAALKCRNGSGWAAVADESAVDRLLKGLAC
jgi:sulfofructose kinase